MTLVGTGASRDGDARDLAAALMASMLRSLDTPGDEPPTAVSVAELAGASPDDIDRLFGGFDHLVEAARLDLFTRHAEAVVVAVRVRLAAVTSHIELLRALPDVVSVLTDPDGRGERSRQRSNLAAALAYPTLTHRIAEVQNRVTRDLAAVLDDLMRRSVIDPSVDCAAVATFMQAIAAGQVVSDIDLDPVAVDRLDQAVVASLRSLLPAPTSSTNHAPPIASTPRGQTTARALLDAARRQIETRSEQGFRIDEILTEVGVSPSSLYHYFGGREGLLEAAWVDWFREQAETDVRYVADVLDRAGNRDDFVRDLVQVVLELQAPSGGERRMQRLMSYAAAARRPRLRAEIGRLEHETNVTVLALLEQARERGLLGDVPHMEMIPVLARALSFGRVTNEMSVSPIDSALWNAAVAPVITWLLGGADTGLP